MKRRAIVTTTAIALAVLSAVPAAGSARMPGSATFTTGLVDELLFQNPSASVRDQWLGRARSLGSTWVRMRANWFLIAPASRPRGFVPTNPADPSYSWGSLDASVRSAAAYGQHVLIQIVAPPKWALGAHAPPGTVPYTWRPSPSALGAFARAVALRYSGRFPDPIAPGRVLPHVSYFQVWNEPNLRIYLSPQWVRGRGGGWAPASPAIYRGLLNAAYRAIKSVQPRAVVLAAGTAPYGDPPGVDRMSPVLFLRELLCLHGEALRPERCRSPAHLDALDHHPYASAPTLAAYSRDDVSIPDLARLQRIADVAVRRGRVLPRRHKSIWVTEIDWDSNPPDRYSKLSLSRQTRYLALTFYELWRQGVSRVFWFTFRDVAYKSLTGAGLAFASGRAKPAAAAFRFPFVAVRSGRGMLTLWGRAPGVGTVNVERKAGHHWRTMLRLRASAGRVFYARRGLRVFGTLRARQGRLASPGYKA